jgi:DNA-binding NtrC family response regulator
MALARVSVVDDNEGVRFSLCAVLEKHGFEAVPAADVPEALKCISSQKYDALLSDLHVPKAGDGLTVVSAMRHAHPNAVTLLLSVYSDVSSRDAILLQTDQTLVKPMAVPDLINALNQRLSKGPLQKRTIESIATILERTTEAGIAEWYGWVEKEMGSWRFL